MINDPQALTPRPDVAELLADQFPGHTMQRLRTADGEYRYLYVSSGVERSFGLDPAKLMGAARVDHEWVHPDDRPRFIDALERSARDLTPLDAEVRVESPLGGYRWVRSLGRPRRRSDGATIWDGVALDVTDRREVLDALQRAMREAKRSEVAEGRFAYIAAQDLSAPLTRLKEAVSALAAMDPADAVAVRDEVARLAETFAAFERAFGAAKDLVAAGRTPPAADDSKPAPALTTRQRQILDKIREGASNRAIADEFGISEGTVKLHVSAILKRLGVGNRTEAARYRG